MLKNEKERFAQIILATFELYGKQPSEMAVTMFWNVLDRFTIDQVEHGFKSHLNDPEQGKFQPKPADIIRHIEGNKSDRMAAAGYAYAKAKDAINSYESVVFDDPAIHYAIRNAFGGWVEFCQAEHHDFDRKKFIDEYVGYRDGLPYPNVLDGITAITNGSQFKDWNKIKPIGNIEQCRRIYKGGSAITKHHDSIPLTSFADTVKAIGGGE